MLGRYYPLAFCLIIFSISGQSFAGIKIAILDSGCNIRYEEGISFVDETIEDLNGHGTSVARIVKGINPGAKLYIAKIFNANGRHFNTSLLVDGINWAISHQVDIINLSCQIRKDDKIVHNAIKEAYQ